MGMIKTDGYGNIIEQDTAEGTGFTFSEDFNQAVGDYQVHPQGSHFVQTGADADGANIGRITQRANELIAKANETYFDQVTGEEKFRHSDLERKKLEMKANQLHTSAEYDWRMAAVRAEQGGREQARNIEALRDTLKAQQARSTEDGKARRMGFSGGAAALMIKPDRRS